LTPAHLSPLHISRRLALRHIKPRGMACISLPADHRECIERIALSIYTDMVNAGATLQETLAAVYLSGSENAVQAMKDQS
jgi:hypothetical protein